MRVEVGYIADTVCDEIRDCLGDEITKLDDQFFVGDMITLISWGSDTVISMEKEISDGIEKRSEQVRSTRERLDDLLSSKKQQISILFHCHSFLSPQARSR